MLVSNGITSGGTKTSDLKQTPNTKNHIAAKRALTNCHEDQISNTEFLDQTSSEDNINESVHDSVSVTPGTSKINVTKSNNRDVPTKRKRGRPRRSSLLGTPDKLIPVNQIKKESSPICKETAQKLSNKIMRNLSSSNVSDEFEEAYNENGHGKPASTATSGQKQTSESNKNKDVSTKAEEEEEEYMCSACNVKFTSIYEHIREYHNGEEVVVEVPEEEIKEDVKAYQTESIAPGKLGLKLPGTKFVYTDPQGDEVGSIKTPGKEEPVFSASEYIKSVQRKIKIPGKRSFLRQLSKLKEHSQGTWMHTKGMRGICHHFVSNIDKMVNLMAEFKSSEDVHPEFQLKMRELFDNPRINVIVITNTPNTPIYTHDSVDLNRPIPMYVVERKACEPDSSSLGGIASYVLSKCDNGGGSDIDYSNTKVIAVMKVVLGSDKTMTIENLVFKKPAAIDSMTPVLEDITDPILPLLKGGKLLKWRCNKCMATTWKFPLHKHSHSCTACQICHKPFATLIALKKHLFLHKKSVSNYCGECHLAFVNSKVLEKHITEHKDHSLCKLCKLFTPLSQKEAHERLHSKLPIEQFPCSVCHKVFSTAEDIKDHEGRSCGRLESKYTCPKCEKKFFTFAALSYHATEHEIAKELKCRFCPKKFLLEKEKFPRKAGKRKPSGYLQKIWHERLHTRNKPYSCLSCPKKFRGSAHKESHMRKAHTSLKQKDIYIYMCNICDAVFSTLKKLDIHKLEHNLPIETVNVSSSESNSE